MNVCSLENEKHFHGPDHMELRPEEVNFCHPVKIPYLVKMVTVLNSEL